MSSGWIAVAAANAFIAVAAGAYAAHGAAHGMEAVAGVEQVAWVETASRYQMWHALALIVAVLLRRTAPESAAKTADPWLRLAGWAFLGGIALFSGSLYLMGLAGYRGLGWVTPAGGLSFLVGWAALAGPALRRRGVPM